MSEEEFKVEETSRTVRVRGRVGEEERMLEYRFRFFNVGAGDQVVLEVFEDRPEGYIPTGGSLQGSPVELKAIARAITAAVV